MHSDSLVELLGKIVPGPFEAAPSVDLHATIYAPVEGLVATLQALRDEPALDFKLLGSLACV